jgi:diguanylate cyclase (GGDEF)-like protein/PAS domain S-box-containing protein
VAPPDASWFLAALAESSDVVVVIDTAATLVWANHSMTRVLGHRLPDVLGASLADYVHPEDMLRAIEVIALSSAGKFDATPITPALYRIADADGDWVTLEVNAATGGDDLMLLTCRVAGDLVLTDRLLEATSGGEQLVPLTRHILEMGRWRHPVEGYAVVFDGGDGRPAVASEGLLPALCGDEPVSGPTPWELAVAQGKDVVIDDITADDAADAVGPDLLARALRAGYVGCVAAPVPDPTSASAPACIVIWSTRQGPTTSGHQYALATMRRALALVLQYRSNVVLLERAARVDVLTGTTSRARFFELLRRRREEAPDGRHSVLYVDLDGFKAVNDSRGHAAGDRMLQVVAARIRAEVPEGATVGRLGGDEFVILCPDGSDAGQAEDLARRIIEAVGRPADLGGTEAVIGASIGVAIGEPGQHPQEVLDRADSALIAAKTAGRGTWRIAAPA